MSDSRENGASRVTDALDLHQLPDDQPVYSCRKCSQVVSLQDELVSKAFNGQSGRAFLMNTTINTRLGKREERILMTGKHVVANLYCMGCNALLGWMYISAPNGHEKYKEVEEAKVVKENNW